MGCRSITNFTVYHYFARAKRKETQQRWAVITLEVYRSRNKAADCMSRWLSSFVCDKGQVQGLRTPFIMRHSETMFVRYVQITYLLIFLRSIEGAARYCTVCPVWYIV